MSSPNTVLKRKYEPEKEPSGEDSRPMCKYGNGCYRQNPIHFQDYRHPPGFQQNETGEPSSKRRKATDVSGEDNDKDKKCTALQNMVPFYLTKVRGIPDKFNSNGIAIGIKDILRQNKSELISTVQFNYMFDIPWLIEQYPPECRDKPLLIVHGNTGASKAELESESGAYENINFFQARLPIAYGTHHSKMMFLLYQNGMRVVIHTANLIEQDWDQKTQGVWMSPIFPKAVESTSYQETEDKFKKDLLEYVGSYITSKCPLSDWVNHIKSHDMSEAKVRIVASVPGRHTSFAKCKWGHLRLRELLQQIGPDVSKVTHSWPVLGQFSSIGSLGKDHKVWLCSEWLDSLASVKRRVGITAGKPQLNLIFPTVENVRTSLEGYSAGGSLPYSSQNAKKQLYLVDYLHEWKSSYSGRSRASPHIKTYARVSADCREAAWFLVTSANLSKAAWGALEKNGSQLMIRSYEIGVLFLPQYYHNDAKTFKALSNFTETQADGTSNDVDDPPCIRFPYDLPLSKYTSADRPWVWNAQYRKPDSHDRLWMPSF